MNVLERYFVHGETIDAIAEDGDRVKVVTALRTAGLSVPTGASCDVATSAILALGFKSFKDYVQRIGLKPIKDQARYLGVPRGAITRTHDAFRNYLRSTGPPDGGVPGCDPGANS